MKTTLKTIAAGLILTTSVFGLNASEISTSKTNLIEVYDEELLIKSWMLNEELFESSELTAENSKGLNEFVEVTDYEMVLESWMVNEELFESSELLAEISIGSNEFVEVADYKLEVENWMVNADFFETSEAKKATCEVVEIEVSNSGSILVECVANEGSLESDSFKLSVNS